MENELKKVKCPICRNCLLFKYDENAINNGVIEGKCGWCNSVTRLNTKTKELVVVQVGSRYTKLEKNSKEQKVPKGG